MMTLWSVMHAETKILSASTNIDCYRTTSGSLSNSFHQRRDPSCCPAHGTRWGKDRGRV